jgi:hypothetical protein
MCSSDFGERFHHTRFVVTSIAAVVETFCRVPAGALHGF